MLKSLDEYLEIVGDEVVSQIHKKASRLHRRHIFQINSTFIGGGVAEILGSLVPLMNNVGVDSGWRVLHGNPAFYDVTKRFHNGLQSAQVSVSDREKRLFMEVNEEFATYTHIDHDLVIVHDPQPLPLIRYTKKTQPWVWRCHIDLSDPDPDLWQFLKRFILRYDIMILSSEEYRKKDLPVEQRVIPPAIDPLSIKNRGMDDAEIRRLLDAVGVPLDKPVITQVSRMDKWKDPEGVLEVFKRVREKADCRLLYCYNLASDDPEGMEIFSRIRSHCGELLKNGDVLFVMGNNDYLVNAVQRFSNVMIQKSTKEGFCLCVTEALWKGKPVVASRVGGIPLQITDGKNGFLMDPHDYDGFADRIVSLLKDPALATRMGEAARETVRDKFLITRLLSDYLDLIPVLLK
jgi:trehalose synthase